MVTIELPRPWTYRTPQMTIDYPAGTHEVFKYVADAAEADGALGSVVPDVPGPTDPDPLDLSVPDLAQHVATIDDPATITTLMRAENRGKTRKGAVEALQARFDELTAD